MNLARAVDAPTVTSRLGVSPVSLDVLDTIINVAGRMRVQLMVIASRNQVGPGPQLAGYVDGLSSELLVRRIRSQATREQVLVCRDHAGPQHHWRDSALSPEEALELAATTIECDVRAGFDLVHVDCGRHPGDVRMATAALLERLAAAARAAGREVALEVGTEDNTGVPVPLRAFEDDLDFILRHARPTFVVGQTGSLVRGAGQVGAFSVEHVRHLVEAVHRRGLRFKEHNCDYLDGQALRARGLAGVDAINIGPELGVLQTRTVVELGQTYGLGRQVAAFLDRSLASGRWARWLYGSPPDGVKAVLAGHYNFASDEYLELMHGLQERVDAGGVIRQRLEARLSWYVEGLTAAPAPPIRTC